jgi:cytochrome P450
MVITEMAGIKSTDSTGLDEEIGTDPDELVAMLLSNTGRRPNPYPILAALRKVAPIHQVAPQLWFLTRHEDIRHVLRDKRFGRDLTANQQSVWGEEKAANSPFLQSQRRWFLNQDPPDHTRLRSQVQSVFTPAAFAAQRTLIEARVEQLLRPLLAKGEFDVVEDFARPLTVSAIGDLMGIPQKDQERFSEWAFFFEVGDDPAKLERADQSVEEYEDYFTALIDSKTRSPGKDLLSKLILTQLEGKQLQPEELLATCILMFGGGFDTTKNLIANFVHAFTNFPNQSSIIRDDPSRIPEAVEEMLRYDGPSMMNYRNVRETVSYKNVVFEQGDQILLSTPSANRDEEVFLNPDEIMIGRKDIRHLALGGGIHFCIGAAMGRLETIAAVNALYGSTRSLELAAQPVFMDTTVFRGPETLRVKVEV